MKEIRDNFEKFYVIKGDALIVKHSFMKQEIMKQKADAKIFDGSNEILETMEKALLEVLSMINDALQKKHEAFAELEERVAKIEKTISKNC